MRFARSCGLLAPVALMVGLGCDVDSSGLNAGVGMAGGMVNTPRPPRMPRTETTDAPTFTEGDGSSLSPPPSPVSHDASIEALAPLDAARPPVIIPDAAAEAAPPAPSDAAPGTGVDDLCRQDPDLALCLRFEGALQDESPRSHDIDSIGVGFAEGLTGTAATIQPGSRIEVRGAPAFDTAGATFEVAIRPRAIGSRMVLIDQGGQYVMHLMGNGRVLCLSGGSRATSTTSITADRWTRLGCTFDSDEVAVWIDGQRAASAPGGRPRGRGGSPPMRIACDDVPMGWSYDGLLDDLRVWRTVRQPR